MYQQTTQAPGQLPVPMDTYDPNTFNMNLPNGNDVFPQIHPGPGIQHLAGYLIGNFRAKAQQVVIKSTLHCFYYNMLAQNHFSNQVFTHWCQWLIDAAEYLLVFQRSTEQEVLHKAVTYATETAIADMAFQYPVVAQAQPQDTQQRLNTALQVGRQLEQDFRAFKQQGIGQNVPYQHPPHWQGGQHPPQQYPQQHQSYGSPHSYQVSGGSQHQPAHNPGAHPYYNNNPPTGPSRVQQVQGQATMGGSTSNPGNGSSGTTQAPSGGRYFVRDEPTPSSPVKQHFSTDIEPTPTPQPTPQPQDVDMNNIQHHDSGYAVPKSLDELRFNPDYYVPNNFRRDVQRPFDRFFNPGGTEIVPAHLSEWTLTRSTPNNAYDPRHYIGFHVRWPDGVVQFTIREYTADMEYLRNEIDDALRLAFSKPTGIVVAKQREVAQHYASPKPIETVRHKLTQDDHLLIEEHPVILDQLFAASSDEENRQEAIREVRQQLELEETDEVPVFEYRSASFFPVGGEEEAQDRVRFLSTSDSLTHLANALTSGYKEGVIPARTVRMLNQRLTRMVNTMLSDNLSMPELDIDNFLEDINDLLPVLVDRLGQEVMDVINDRTESLLETWLRFERDEDTGGYSLVDERAILQVGFMAEELISLNLTQGAALIRESTHPRLRAMVTDMINRHTKEAPGRVLQIMTLDGVTLQIILGWLDKKAVLVKIVE